jgi:hypothetical protein
LLLCGSPQQHERFVCVAEVQEQQGGAESVRAVNQPCSLYFHCIEVKGFNFITTLLLAYLPPHFDIFRVKRAGDKRAAGAHGRNTCKQAAAGRET